MPTRRQNYEQDIVFFLSRWSSIVHMASWVNKHPVESHWWIEDFPGCHVWLSTCHVSLKWHGYRWTLETLRRRCAATSFVTSWPLGDTSKCGIRLVAHPRKRGPVGQSWPRFTIAGQAEIRPVYQVHTGIYRGVTIFFMFKNVVLYPPQGAILNCVLLVLGIHSSTKHGKHVEQTPGLRARNGPKLTFLKQRDSSVGYYPPKTSRKKKNMSQPRLIYIVWLLPMTVVS